MQIVVNSYHFNELTSHLSQGTLTLRAIYNVSDTATQVANVNVMTHLIHNRVLELISGGYIVLATTKSSSIYSSVDSEGGDWIFKIK